MWLDRCNTYLVSLSLSLPLASALTATATREAKPGTRSERGYQPGGMPGVVVAWELIPWEGGGIGGGTAAVLPGLKLGIHDCFFIPMWTMYMSGCYHLISCLAVASAIYSLLSTSERAR